MNITVRVEPIETAPKQGTVFTDQGEVFWGEHGEWTSTVDWATQVDPEPKYWLPDGFPSLESTEPVADSREGLRLHDLASPFDEIADSVAILKEYLEDYEQSAFAQTIAQLRGNRETWFTIKYLRDSNSKVCGFMMFDASGEASVRASLGMEAK